jgi:hypothetical protein
LAKDFKRALKELDRQENDLAELRARLRAQ